MRITVFGLVLYAVFGLLIRLRVEVAVADPILRFGVRAADRDDARFFRPRLPADLAIPLRGHALVASGELGRIHVSEAVRDQLGDGWRLADERVLELKGKGATRAWFHVDGPREDGDRYPRAGL